MLKRDFRQNPECYNARAVSSAIYSLTRSSTRCDLPSIIADIHESAFLKELIVRFVAYCLQRGVVSEFDIIFTAFGSLSLSL